MTWKKDSNENGNIVLRPGNQYGNYGINKQCFLRKDHDCGKIFGASKSCFVACPTNDDLDVLLSLVSEKLSRFGIETNVAIKDRVYGQDIFCTKICGKIIESKFCIVILDDSIKDEKKFPNPNVYFEYGVMTALRKYIIPLQKEEQTLAFNIQSNDTIKYSAKNINSEIENALQEAINISTDNKRHSGFENLTDETIQKRFEIVGLKSIRAQNNEVINDFFENTQFRGYTDENSSCIIFLGRVDDDRDFQAYLEDIDLILHRIEVFKAYCQDTIKTYSRSKESVENPEKGSISLFPGFYKKQAELYRNYLYQIEFSYYFGFILSNYLDSSKFVTEVNKKLLPFGEGHTVFSGNNCLDIIDLHIDLNLHLL